MAAGIEILVIVALHQFCREIGPTPVARLKVELQLDFEHVTSPMFHVISVLIYYQSTDMARKIAISKTRSGAARKAPRRKPEKIRKSGAAKKSATLRKRPGENHGLAGVRPPLPGGGKRGEKGYLSYRLRQAQAAARLTLERALADLSVTPPQFAVLTLLKTHPGLSGADLARMALLTPQTVGIIIRNLERDGAIRKTPHPVHGRVLQWTLTRRGGTLLDKCGRHVRALERRLTSGLTTKAQVTIQRWLSKIAADLQQDGWFRAQ